MSRISSTCTMVQDVSDYAKIVFDGFPAVTVTMADNENGFWSTGENQRAFNFIIDIYIQISRPDQNSTDNSSLQSAERKMSNVVSEMIDSFDSFIEFDDQATYLKASPSTWDFVESGEGFLRHAVIRLQVVQLRVN
jgi:hypothetical protein